MMEDQWRRYGEARRAALLEEDALEGGTSFEINGNCKVQKYFQLAERVTHQFRALCSSLDSSSLDDAYVMGHRLVTFLSSALPRHPDYMDYASSRSRNKSLHDLVWIKDRMAEIALRIDEEQLNKYITNHFDPQPDDDSTVSSEEKEETNFSAFGRWESFTGWSNDDTIPGGTETDTSSCDFNSSREMSSESEAEPNEFSFRHFSKSQQYIARKAKPIAKEEKDEESVPEPRYEPFRDGDEHDDDEETCQDSTIDSLHEHTQSSSFLYRIANEDVYFESDSDANDSWAQDGESGISASSGTGLTCDPARIAFREIMSRISKKTLHVSRWDSFSPSSHSSLSFNEGEDATQTASPQLPDPCRRWEGDRQTNSDRWRT